MIGCIHEYLDDTSVAATCGVDTNDIANLDDLSDDLSGYWHCLYRPDWNPQFGNWGSSFVDD